MQQKLISPALILPSQNFLKEKTLRYILECFITNRYAELPTSPIVRKNLEDNKYVAIDGHNLIAVLDMMGLDVLVNIVDDPNNEIKVVDGKLSTANDRLAELKIKFDNVLEEQKKIYVNDKIHAFSDLRSKYTFLENTEVARTYFNI